ncbi:MAG: dTDP-4-dehydrorhamnose 3,5-epimerase [Bacteroidetes bacterium]|nr:dTDP-4-dehydrorhamnose 3,5-epimerase [Bacteroidota bacterium]
MNCIPTHLAGCFIVEPKIIFDQRGYFTESFNEKTFFECTGEQVHFVQDNQSYSSKGVLRGLHYQTGAHMQAKLVRVLSGEVLDIAVDIRPESPTYGQHVSVVLTAENQKQFYLPRGFAHGFLVLSETATFFYKCDNFYNKESEGGIAYNDPSLGIDWMLPEQELILSDKDKVQPNLANARKIW